MHSVFTASELSNYLIDRPTFFQRSAQSDVPSSVQQDVEQCQKLLIELNNNTRQLKTKIEQVQISNLSFNQGIGYFDTKNLLFAQYLTELHFYMVFKVNGIDLTSGTGFDLYKNLIYLKTLLMKLGPVDKKLEYKVNKLLRQQAKLDIHNEQHQQEDSLKYKPQPQKLMKERTHENQEKSEKKYIAPKISSNLMKDDKKKQKQELNQQRKQKFLMRKLKNQILEGEEPETVNMKSPYQLRMQNKQKERIAYEEDNFLRLQQSKKDKYLRKKVQREVNRDDVGDLSQLSNIRQLLKYQKLIEEDFRKEEKLNKTLGLSKKIKKRQ